MEIINENNNGSAAPAQGGLSQIETTSFNLTDLFHAILAKWYWYVIALAITFSVAALYLMRTPVIYTRTMSVLFKDEKRGGGSSSNVDFSQLGVLKPIVNMDNELITLKSPTIMATVVERLGLNNVYTTRKGLRTIELYRQSPLLVTPLDSIQAPGYSFVITPRSSSEYTLSDFRKGLETWDVEVPGKVGEPVDTPVGNFTLDKSQWFADSYINTAIRYSHAPVERYAASYAARITPTRVAEKGTIINISISDASIRKAEDILLEVIQVYNEQWIQDRNQIAVSTSQFIDGRLGVIERELGHVEGDIAGFKSANLLPDINAASSMYMSQSAENRRQILELNNQISIAQFIRDELVKEDLNEPIPANIGLDNGGIQTQIGEYNSLVFERNRLLASSSEKNPVVREMAESIHALHNNIIQSIDNLIALLKTRIKSAEHQEVVTTGQLATTPNQAKYLLSVERQQKVKEALYLFLLQKREENQLSQAFTAYNTRVIMLPNGSMAPTSPMKGTILSIALIVGLLIPTLAVFIKETMNTTVRGRKDLEKLSLPFIGEIPKYTKTSGHKISLGSLHGESVGVVVRESGRNIINEAFRVLRTNLDFMSNRNGSNVIVFTSFNPSSGKTFMSVNLAVSFAIKGKKTLVIDGDLRRGSASEYVHSPKQGLCDYLSGRVDDWHGLTVNYGGFENCSILPAGKLPPNPTELLEMPRLETLIAELRKEYDYIFIDCPPVDIVADTRIIDSFADRTVFVIRTGIMERSMLSDLETLYRERRYKNMAVILNGTLSGSGRYAYHYGYKYGAYYGNASE